MLFFSVFIIFLGAVNYPLVLVYTSYLLLRRFQSVLKRFQHVFKIFSKKIISKRYKLKSAPSLFSNFFFFLSVFKAFFKKFQWFLKAFSKPFQVFLKALYKKSKSYLSFSVSWAAPPYHARFVVIALFHYSQNK